MQPGEGFAVDPSGDAPLYLQLAGQIERRVASGSLAQGERLPAVRQLAGMLGVSPATVEHAYTLGRQRGVLEARPGRGMFVAGDHLDTAERLTLLEPVIRQLVGEAKQFALPAACVLAVLRKQLEEGNPS